MKLDFANDLILCAYNIWTVNATNLLVGKRQRATKRTYQDRNGKPEVANSTQDLETSKTSSKLFERHVRE